MSSKIEINFKLHLPKSSSRPESNVNDSETGQSLDNYTELQSRELIKNLTSDIILNGGPERTKLYC